MLTQHYHIYIYHLAKENIADMLAPQDKEGTFQTMVAIT